MSKHFTNSELDVKDFDDAVKKVAGLLCESYGIVEGKTKKIILHHWEPVGFGSSVVLGDVAKHLRSTIWDDSDTRKRFGRIVYVDCSLCGNTRTMQRVIAEELNLGHVMNIFDKQDEDDDFRDVVDSSRKGIPSIGSLINESLRNERFLMIFNYGKVEEMDLVECGIPLFGKGALLCSEECKFQAKQRESKTMLIFPTIIIYMHSPFGIDIGTQIHHMLRKEAVGVICDTGMDDINPEIILDCFWYVLFLTTQLDQNSIGADYDWATHACNYWICDGIVGGDRAWVIGNALYGVIPRLENSPDKTRHLTSFLNGSKEPYVGWSSVTSNKLGADNICDVPAYASSYFLTFEGDDPVYIPNDLFQLASNLRVLKLSNCSFDFASPPFRCSHNLRFLWLDHCTNIGKERSGGQFFPNLLVLDIRFTNYVLLPQMIELMTNLRELNTKGVSWKTMSHVWEKLQKLQKLRVTKSSDVVTVDSCSSIDMMNLELLDLSGNTHMESLPALSSARNLKMLVLDGCSSLVNVLLDGVPPLLECISFDGYGPAENWTHTIQLPEKELRLKSPIAPSEIVQVTKISLQGCGRLQNLFLRALPNLEELDLSGTSIKILNLCAMDVLKLKKLFLLGCQQLRRLIWDGYPRLEVIQVDTEREARSTVCCGEQKSIDKGAFIAFTDGRFIWSALLGLNQYLERGSRLYLLMSCMSHSQANITNSIDEIGPSEEGLVPTCPLLFLYSNYTSLAKDVTCSSLMWSHQRLETSDAHIEIGEGSYNLERMLDNAYFAYFAVSIGSLHVHDNSSITSIPPMNTRYWMNLKWCHVQRCPKIHHLFSYLRGVGDKFPRMRTFSASDLLVAYSIWGRGICSQYTTKFLYLLQHIYLYNCPRLVFVLPISFTLPNLETLQIAYCSSLRHVFPLDDKCPLAISSGVTFENLKHIKLYHLHSLEQICEARLTAPALQTIGLRDCWGLKRLPAVARQGPKPVVDCEKDCWNRLEWDGLDAGHDPSLFETRHSAYYKKTLPRVSFLR